MRRIVLPVPVVFFPAFGAGCASTLREQEAVRLHGLTILIYRLYPDHVRFGVEAP